MPGAQRESDCIRAVQEDDVDPLDAFMDAAVNPEVAAAEKAEAARKEALRTEQVKALAVRVTISSRLYNQSTSCPAVQNNLQCFFRLGCTSGMWCVCIFHYFSQPCSRACQRWTAWHKLTDTLEPAKPAAVCCILQYKQVALHCKI